MRWGGWAVTIHDGCIFSGVTQSGVLLHYDLDIHVGDGTLDIGTRVSKRAGLVVREGPEKRRDYVAGMNGPRHTSLGAERGEWGLP
jgi:hypothetical protein